MSDRYKYLLSEDRIPKAWYNIQADMPVPPTPVLHPGTKEPVTPDFLSVLFPMSIILQEISNERWIEIPEPVREVYKLWRPTPLHRARRLELALDTPAHIYYKYEGASPAGSHKPNTAVAQAFYNKEAGTKALTTETGAGQWGSSLAMACNFFGLDLEIYMVKVSYYQKPYRRVLMHSYGAEVFPSPTDRTEYGRRVLAETPDTTGSLGIAISEAVEAAATSGGTKKYSLGSVLNHVLTHQSVIGLEALEQMEMAGEYPDVVIGCAGGGSNFAGFAYPFLHKTLTEGKKTRFIAAEPAACPTLTRGAYTFDYGDTAAMAPIVKMHTLGHTFIPSRHPRGRAALPRHGPLGKCPGGSRADRGGGAAAACHLRGGDAVHPRRGDHPRAGKRPRDPRRPGRGASVQGERRKEGDRLQPVRPRPLRHGSLRGVFCGRAARLRVSRGDDPRGHVPPARGRPGVGGRKPKDERRP